MATSIGDVAILGAGQVGTMPALALMAARRKRRARAGSVTVHDVDVRAATESIAGGAGDRIAASSAEPFGADTVVLSIPVPQIVSLLDQYGAGARSGALVIDNSLDVSAEDQGSASRLAASAPANTAGDLRARRDNLRRAADVFGHRFDALATCVDDADALAACVDHADAPAAALAEGGTALRAVTGTGTRGTGAPPPRSSDERATAPARGGQAR